VFKELNMKNLLARFVDDESGAAAIEYALIAGLIALAIVVGATALGSAIGAKFTSIAGQVATAGN
jgi:pilus assembly protein Flp/PilA